MLFIHAFCNRGNRSRTVLQIILSCLFEKVQRFSQKNKIVPKKQNCYVVNIGLNAKISLITGSREI